MNAPKTPLDNSSVIKKTPLHNNTLKRTPPLKKFITTKKCKLLKSEKALYMKFVKKNIIFI